MKKSIKITKKTIFFWLVFIVIFCSHDTILFGTNADSRFLAIRKAIPFLLIACLLVTRRVIRIRKIDLCKVLFVLILPIISCFVNRENLNNYIYRAAIMLAAILFVLVGDKHEFHIAYDRILYFLSIWSIATYVMMVLLPGIVSKFPSVTNSNGTPFYFLGFSLMNSRLHYGMVRNSSIFREPGVFCVMLTIAMLNEMIILKKMRTKRILVYTAAMVTTYSTAGYIILLLLFLYYLAVDTKARHKGLLITLLAAAALVMATQTDLLSAEGAIFDKFVKGSNSYGSWLARLTSVTSSIQIALQNPVCGIGRYALYDTVLGTAGVYRAVDNTNTILVGFAAYGLMFGLVLTWGCWRFIRKQQRNLLAACYLFVLLLLALSNEDFGQNILFYVLVFEGLCTSWQEGPEHPKTIKELYATKGLSV